MKLPIAPPKAKTITAVAASLTQMTHPGDNAQRLAVRRFIGILNKNSRLNLTERDKTFLRQEDWLTGEHQHPPICQLIDCHTSRTLDQVWVHFTVGIINLPSDF